MSDIVERLRVWPAAYGEDALSSTYVGTTMKAAADEIEHLRSGLDEADAEIAKFSDISFSQHQKDYAALKAFVKQLSDALLKVRPLGGSELFVKRCGDYYADPEYCGRMIDELRASLDKEIRARIRLEKSNPVTPAVRGET